MKLSPSYFLDQAAAEEALLADNYDFFVVPTESLAKSAALGDAQRQAELLKEESRHV